jgi:hypothetical protein
MTKNKYHKQLGLYIHCLRTLDFDIVSSFDIRNSDFRF